MNMFGLEGSGFIIAVGLTILLAGLIVYYVNAKIISLENAVMQQNSVLGNFINGVKQEIGMNGGSTGAVKANVPEAAAVGGDAAAAKAGGLATPEALEAAENFVNDPHNRIDVSDDSESESDSDSDSDEEDNNEKVQTTSGIGEIQIIVDEMLNKTQLNQKNDIKIIELTNDDVKSTSSEGSTEYTIEAIEVEEVVETPVVTLDIKDISEEIVPINFKTLKVSELRKIVSEKKLKTATVAKGLKKEELIELLTNE